MDYMKDTGYSQVWEQDGYIWKRQPKYLMDNEVHALTLLAPEGIVPEFERVELELLRMQKLINTRVTDPTKFQLRCANIMEEIKRAGLRHGDLTRPHIFVTEHNWPMVIDWGESRWGADPRPDKRPEGDWYWMTRTVQKILEENGYK